MLTSLCESGYTADFVAEMLHRDRKNVLRKASRLGLHFLAEGEWSAGDIDRLRKLVAAEKSPEDIALALGRTRSAVWAKAQRLGLQFVPKNDEGAYRKRKWTLEERELLKELWLDDTQSMVNIARKLRRGVKAIQSQACAMGLGPRQGGVSWLTPMDIAQELGVTDDTVRNWIGSGLKAHRRRMGASLWMIDADDLLEFLEAHQSSFNAVTMGDCLFFEEPAWLKKKKVEDARKWPRRHRVEWTLDDDQKLTDMFRWGKSESEIAKDLNRTESSVLNRIFVLGLTRPSVWTKEELDILESCATLSEAVERLPGRSYKAIRSKRERISAVKRKSGGS